MHEATLKVHGWNDTDSRRTKADIDFQGPSIPALRCEQSTGYQIPSEAIGSEMQTELFKLLFAFVFLPPWDTNVQTAIFTSKQEVKQTNKKTSSIFLTLEDAAPTHLASICFIY